MNNWTRAELKGRAKSVLQQNYWIAFVVALILLVSLGSGTINYKDSFDNFKNHEAIIQYNGELNIHTFKDIKGIYNDLDFPGKGIITGMVSAAVIFGALFMLALRVFLFNPLAAGCYKFYSTSAESPHSNMEYVGLAFQKGKYWGIVKAMFLKNLYIFLWSLLFIIPGIIKAYAYRMVPYIMTDNPEMQAAEAISLSRKMMKGQKWKAFVLDLSFIGWYLLGALAFGIGALFVNPYKFSTDAQLYLVVRENAISDN